MACAVLGQLGTVPEGSAHTLEGNQVVKQFWSLLLQVEVANCFRFGRRAGAQQLSTSFARRRML